MEVDLSSGQKLEDVEVALDDMPTGTVVFVVRDEQGAPVEQVDIESFRDGKPDQGSVGAGSATGVYETHLEPGAYKVTIRAASGAVVGAADVDVREGETTKVEVTLHPKP
jgi:hypothetical protein